MSVTREKAEAEQLSSRLGKEVESVKVRTTSLVRWILIWSLQSEVTAVIRMAKQERDKGRQSEKERGEDAQMLRRMQTRIQVRTSGGGCLETSQSQDLKSALGGRVRQLEAELRKTEAAKAALEVRTDGEVREVSKEAKEIPGEPIVCAADEAGDREPGEDGGEADGGQEEAGG